MTDRNINVRIPEDAHARLAAAARERGLGAGWVASRLIIEGLERLRPVEDFILTTPAPVERLPLPPSVFGGAPLIDSGPIDLGITRPPATVPEMEWFPESFLGAGAAALPPEPPRPDPTPVAAGGRLRNIDDDSRWFAVGPPFHGPSSANPDSPPRWWYPACKTRGGPGPVVHLDANFVEVLGPGQLPPEPDPLA